MKVPPHLIRLYVKTGRRYKKLLSRLRRNKATPFQRRSFILEIKKLLAKLRALEAQLKIAAAMGTVLMVMNATPAEAQTTKLGPFVSHDRTTNPLREPLFNGKEPALAIVDFDDDGDMDVIQGELDYYYGGLLRYFENQSKQGYPVYLEKKDDENPFDGIRAITEGVSPAFADFDKDGDMDLMLAENGSKARYTVGTATQTIHYYRNDAGNFVKQSQAWNENTKQGSPFFGVTLGYDIRLVSVDFDKDGDTDVVVGSYQYYGSYPNYTYAYVHLYDNNGKGTLTHKALELSPDRPAWGALMPALADLDGDGDLDLVLGTYYEDHLLYYRQDSDGQFVQQSEEWDPVSKEGNPFFEFETASNASPAFIDFNNDGHLDLFVADEQNRYGNKYSDHIINYYKNTGNGTFEEIDGLTNPFDGVYVKRFASPVLLDLDGDDELDVLVGNKYDSFKYDYYGNPVYTYSQVQYYKNEGGVYERVPAETDPFKDLQVDGYFAPSFGDVDGDGDLDLTTGSQYGGVYYFVNNAGKYELFLRGGPFRNVNVLYQSETNLVDIDNDSDLDLFLSNGYREFHYYINSGTSKAPLYVEQTGVNNPLDTLGMYSSGFTPRLNFTDLDHDGDLDVVFPGSSPNQRIGEVIYVENTGTKEKPVFGKIYYNFMPDADARSPQVFFVDFDKDGDLDTFVGNYDGTVSYLENQNPAVVTTTTSVVIQYEPGLDEAVVIEPALTLTDSDNDVIIKATVTIEDFQPNEKLGFTPMEGISGAFNTETGVLTFNGKASIKVYQSLLRTVTFESIPDAGRRKSVKGILPKDIAFAVYDEDFTNPAQVSKTVNIYVNTPPEIEPEPINSPTGALQTINLMTITFDADDNLDPEAFTIVQQPVSGAKATLEFISPTVVNLLVSYEGTNFSGTDHLTVRACDMDGACAENVITIQVNESSLMVYNAVAPNSSGDNRMMRITGLPAKNKVSIFNRWGDKVFETENYTNTQSKAFTGQSSNGTALPSGTYFYTIEMPGKEMVSGYLTLKQ